jgi:hypothetical protein
MSDDGKSSRPGQQDEPADEVEAHGKFGANEDPDDEVEAHRGTRSSEPDNNKSA